MSLVDYDASSDEEEGLHQQPQGDKQLTKAEEPPTLLDPSPTRNDNPHLPHPQPPNQRTTSSLNKEALHFSSLSESSELKLPDASLLFDSPTMPGHLGHNTDHSSRVAAAMAENATRKRDINVSVSTYPHSKIPKGNLPHMKNVPETGGGLLLPPQLSGRSNIVTEDISKLFRKKTSS
ncbi:putative glycerol-3-phosphate dehydrogenase [NAD(+)] 1, cytosolic-like [Capsicum annuum]|nr:putative glycerol-3-phosphate dehydrogenase [NAD(+)] 1, cytosolic-like [Capsicum annuum]